MNESEETVSSATETADTEDDLYAPPYAVGNECLSIERVTKNGSIYIPLCNFAPRILSEVSYDDGAEVIRKYRIGGTHADGRPLPPVDVPASDLEKMEWIANNWDATCDLFVTSNVEKHVRCAIKSTARFADKENVFAHTGWKKIDGEWHYLLPGNGRFDVQLGGKNQCYEGADSYIEDDLAVLRDLLDTEFVPQSVLYPCLSLVFLSPLNEFLHRVGYEPKFLLLLLARTGSRKSTLAALMLSFFGRFSVTDLPMSFHDTVNSMIHTAFALKDTLTVYDDYHPTGKRDADSMKSTMQTLARGYGDRVGRNRLTPDCSLRETRPPRGNAIVTAEFAPDIGESGSARLFCVEMPGNKTDLEKLSELQAQAADGVLMRGMHAYLEWFKKEFLTSDEAEAFLLSFLKSKYECARAEWRSKLTEKRIVFHNRLPDTLACFGIGMYFFMEFLRSVSLLKADDEEIYEDRFTDILLAHAEKQSAAVEQDKPTHIFLRKFSSLVEAGQASLAPKNQCEYLPGNCLGYEDEQYYYLFFEITHRAVKKFCEEQDEGFSISSISLGKALAEEGFLNTENCTGNTRTMKFGGKSKRVLLLRKDKVREVVGE